MLETILAISAVIISAVSLFFSRSDRDRDKFNLLHDKVEHLQIESKVIEERLRHTVEQTQNINKKIDELR